MKKRALSLLLAVIMVLATMATAGVMVVAADDDAEPVSLTDASIYSGTPDYSWFTVVKDEENSTETTTVYKADKKAYTLTSADQFYGFANVSNGTGKGTLADGSQVAIAKQTFAGITVTLACDVIINEGDADDWFYNTASYTLEFATVNRLDESLYNWTPIGTGYAHKTDGTSAGSTSHSFDGTFDGGKHYISGIYNVMTRSGGLFGHLKGTVQNFALVNSVFYLNGNYDVIQTATQSVGAVAGRALGGTVENVYADAYVRGGIGVGGIVGLVPGGAAGATITNCTFAGYIDSSAKGKDAGTGGILGIHETSTSKTTIKNCAMLGTIYAGIDYAAKDIKLNHGWEPDQTNTTKRLGGIFGDDNNKAAIDADYVLSDATITVADRRMALWKGSRTSYHGGIGWARNASSTVDNAIFCTTKANTQTAWSGDTKGNGLWSGATAANYASLAEEEKTVKGITSTEMAALELTWDNWSKVDGRGWMPSVCATMLAKVPADLATIDHEGYYSGVQDYSWYVDVAATEAKGSLVKVGAANSQKTFTINTADQLIAFRELSNGRALVGNILIPAQNFAGETILLGADITVNKGDATEWWVATNFSGSTSTMAGGLGIRDFWNPIGDTYADDPDGLDYSNTYNANNGVAFAGTFDGQGHYISGIYSLNQRDGGLFCATTAAAKIQNFAVVNSVFYNYGSFADKIAQVKETVEGAEVTYLTDSWGTKLLDSSGNPIVYDSSKHKNGVKTYQLVPHMTRVDAQGGTQGMGVVCRPTGTTVQNVYNSSYMRAGYGAGGIVGYANSTTQPKVIGCVFAGVLNLSTAGNTADNGGLVGSCGASDGCNPVIRDSSMLGTIYIGNESTTNHSSQQTSTAFTNFGMICGNIKNTTVENVVSDGTLVFADKRVSGKFYGLGNLTTSTVSNVLINAEKLGNMQNETTNENVTVLDQADMDDVKPWDGWVHTPYGLMPFDAWKMAARVPGSPVTGTEYNGLPDVSWYVDLAKTTVTTIIQTPSETEVEVLDPDTNEPTGDTKIEYSYTYSTPTVNLVAKEGDGDGKNVYYIDSAADLYGLMYLVNGMYKISYSQEFTEIDNETGEEKTVTKSGTVAIPTQHLKGKVIKMTADITVNNGDASTWTATQIKGLQPWMPIGLQHSWGNAASTRVFEGEFDGQGHTVSGIYVNGVWGQFKDKNFTNGAADARQLGFFGHVYEAKVHDFSFVNAMLYTDPTVASNTNEGNALIDKCERSEVYNIYSNATQYGETRLAGIAGYTQDKKATEAGKTKIYNCIYDGTLYVIKSGANSANVGGIAGVAEGNSSYKTTVTVEITDCLVTGTIVYLNSTSKGVTGCGSILGASSNTAAKVTNCVSNVTVVNNCFTAEVAKGMKAMAGGTTTISNSVWNSASMPVGVAAQTGATAKDSLIGYKTGFANWTDRPLDIPVPTAAWKLMNKQFDAAKLVFVQETDVTTIEHADGNYEGYTVRLVSEIRDITATEAGFEILVDSEFVNLGGSTTAYKALNAKEEGTGRIAQVKADANTYFSALEINVATGEEISFTVRPYIVIEGKTSYGTAYTITYSADGSFLGAVMANK